MTLVTSFSLALGTVDHAALSTHYGDLLIFETGLTSDGSGVMDASGLTLSAAQVDALQAQGRALIGYLNVAVTDHYRGYWDAAWVDFAGAGGGGSGNQDVGTVQPGAPDWLVANHGYATSGATTFGYIVDYTDTDWQARLIAEAIHMVTPVEEGGLGLDGVFLDDVGRYYDAAANDPGYSAQQAARDMITLVNTLGAAIRAVAPDAYIAVNGGAYIGWDADWVGTAALQDMFDTVDALLMESQGWTGAWQDAIANWGAGHDFLAVEHASSVGNAQAFANTMWAIGAVPLVTASDAYDTTAPVPLRTGTADADTITGGEGPNRLDGFAGDDSLSGLGGNDFLVGGAGLDTLLGGAGNDTLLGGDDADSIVGDAGNDHVLGGGGADTVRGGTGNDKVFGGIGNDLITAIDGQNTLLGQDGDDTLEGGSGNDRLLGGDGADSMLGGDGADHLLGGLDGDYLSGGIGNDTLLDHEGADSLSGGTGDDFLSGGEDRDTLDGGAGRDTIYGGAGRDALLGGGWEGDDDPDIFLYNAVSDSGAGSANRDWLRNFDAGTDILHLARIDADTTQAGNQAFTFIGEAAFSGSAGELRLEVYNASLTIVQADVDGDGIADFEIEMTNISGTLTGSDFIL